LLLFCSQSSQLYMVCSMLSLFLLTNLFISLFLFVNNIRVLWYNKCNSMFVVIMQCMVRNCGWFMLQLRKMWLIFGFELVILMWRLLKLLYCRRNCGYGLQGWIELFELICWYKFLLDCLGEIMETAYDIFCKIFSAYFL
jgi:hypothetical protein